MAAMVEGSKLRLALAALAAFVVVFGGVRLLERARAAPARDPGRLTIDPAPSAAVCGVVKNVNPSSTALRSSSLAAKDHRVEVFQP